MPASVAVHVQGSATSPSRHYPVTCDSHSFGHGLLASDCAEAIGNLPTDQAGDVHMDLERHTMIYPRFSPDAAADRHRLPIYEEVGTCGVRVRLTAFPMDDYSSWRIIRLRIMDVRYFCVEHEDAGIGGSTITGEFKRVELMLYSTMGDSDLSLNMSNKTYANSQKEKRALLRA